MTKIITSPDVYRESINSLNSMGYDVIFSKKNTNVMPQLSYHTDMQITSIGHNTFVCAPECYEYYKEIFANTNAKLIKGNTYLSCNYPMDIAYNIIVGEKAAIHNFKYTDDVLRDRIKDKKLINVSQGYTSCTLCRLFDNAYITSDAGIYKTLISNKFDALLIEDRDILLPGFEHGFFGGATLMLPDSFLAANGDFKLLKSYDDIKSFCRNYNVNLISLCDKQIMDIGSFVKM